MLAPVSVPLQSDAFRGPVILVVGVNGSGKTTDRKARTHFIEQELCVLSPPLHVPRCRDRAVRIWADGSGPRIAARNHDARDVSTA